MFAGSRRGRPSAVPLPSHVDSVAAAVSWLDDLARLYRRIGEEYDNRPYLAAGQALSTITRRIRDRGITDIHRLRGRLTAVAGQLRTRAEIVRQFGEDDVALGLDIAATDTAGLASALSTPRARVHERSPHVGRSL